MEFKMELEQAIRISKIIVQAPEERLPMILSVLEKADVRIGGLIELEEWKAIKDQAYLMDVREFVADMKKQFPVENGKMKVPTREFSEFCKLKKMKPILVKRLLYRCGYIKANEDAHKKIEYTETVWKDGQTVRCVVVQEPETGSDRE